MVVLPGELHSCCVPGCKAVKQRGFKLHCDRLEM